MRTKIIAIAAMSENRVIGKQGMIPWHISEDMKRFKALTMGHAVLVGRKTYDSYPPKFRPLPGRKNIVLTRSKETKYPDEVTVLSSIDEFKKLVQSGTYPLIWIAGGTEVYKATMPFWDELELTRVKGAYEGDAYFPEFESYFKFIEGTAGDQCRYEKWSLTK